jgi:hypothetical protein
MKTIKINLVLLMIVSLVMNGCQKQLSDGSDRSVANVGLNVKESGATQISGLGFFAETGECTSPQGATFAITLTGDLAGCLYVFIDEFDCSPSGTYREKGREHFVGTYKGETGTFWTGYKFEGKYEGCSADGAALGAEIFGRCQHPIVDGSGEGVFEGVTGRMDFKDDIEAGNFPYRGHFRF